MAEKPNILIAVPTARETMHTATAGSLIGLSIQLTNLGIPFSVKNITGADLPQIRNCFASLVLHSQELTHLLFIDSDMDFRPGAVLEMLKQQRDVIGLACIRKELNLEKIIELSASKPLQQAVAKASLWCFEADFPLTVTNGVAEVFSIGMGVTLITKKALVEMSRSSSLRVSERHHFSSSGLNAPLVGYFDNILSPNHRSEDFSFCDRWRTIGGKIFMLTGEPVAHVGAYHYTANFSDLR